MKTLRKILAGFSLSFVMELLSFLTVVVGLIVMIQACTSKKIVTTSSYKETVTSSSDTIKEDLIVNHNLEGATAEASENNATRTIRDSVVIKYNIKDSVVYKVRYRDVKVPVTDVDHPPVFAYHDRGYAKAYMEKGKLFVFFNLYPYFFTDTIPNAKVTINNTNDKVIDQSNTTDVTKSPDIGSLFKLLIVSVVASVIIRILWPLFKSTLNI